MAVALYRRLVVSGAAIGRCKFIETVEVVCRRTCPPFHPKRLRRVRWTTAASRPRPCVAPQRLRTFARVERPQRHGRRRYALAPVLVQAHHGIAGAVALALQREHSARPNADEGRRHARLRVEASALSAPARTPLPPSTHTHGAIARARVHSSNVPVQLPYVCQAYDGGTRHKELVHQDALVAGRVRWYRSCATNAAPRPPRRRSPPSPGRSTVCSFPNRRRPWARWRRR